MRRFIASAAALTILSALVAEPAQAAGYFDMWHDQSYRGDIIRLTGGDAHLGNDSDEAHSVWNTTNVAWIMFDNQDYGGDRWCVKSGVRHYNLGNIRYQLQNFNFGDRVTSVQRLGSNTCPSGVKVLPRVD